MKHLPPYWAIKIDKEHPLFERFKKYVHSSSTITTEEEDWNTYDFVTHNEVDEGDEYGGFNMHKQSIDEECIIIFLEQFFEQETYSIY